MTKQSWMSPELTSYGSASKITQQNNINFNKSTGSGDSIAFINVTTGITTNVPVPGGILQNIQVNGSIVS